jgi:predicted negative regulator of RcsB-dependent stress response
VGKQPIVDPQITLNIPAVSEDLVPKLPLVEIELAFWGVLSRIKTFNMESDITKSASLYTAWAWFEKNKRQVILGTIGAIIIGLIVYFIVWQRQEKQADASRALTRAFAANVTGGQSESADTYLKISGEYANTKAAGQARLLAATALFSEGKYDQSLAEFQRFAREQSGSPYAPQAMLGIASSLEAQGKTDQALETYANLVERHPNSPVAPQAKYSLARLRDAKGDFERALPLYEDVGRDQFSSIGAEAGMRAEEIKRNHPELAAKVQPRIPVLAPGTNTAPVPGAQ